MSNPMFSIPNTHSTIQAALDDLPDTGGVVDIEPGVYQENLVSNSAAVLLRGSSTLGPSWTTGSAPNVSIQAASGTILDIGSDSEICDPGWRIEGIQFRNIDGGSCQYGVRARRMRNLTIRDCQFVNFQPAGTALYLDGANGWQEWASLWNVWFSNCSNAIMALNTTDLQIHGGGVLNVTCYPNSCGLQTQGASDTLRCYGWSVQEVATGILLNSVAGAGWESAVISGLRHEMHTAAGIGVQVNSSTNVIENCRFYGAQTGIEFSKTACDNDVRSCVFSAMASNGKNVVDSGQRNIVM